MSVVTIERYRLLTRDSTTASSTVQTALDLSEQAVAEYLRRDDLGLSYRTERLRVWDTGKVYPAHVPVTEVLASASYEAENEAIIRYVNPDDLTQSVGDWPVRSRYDTYPASAPYATVNYIGGWTLATMPVKVQAAVASVAKVLAGAATPPGGGTQAASVGDVSVTWQPDSVDTGAWLDTQVPGTTKQLASVRYKGGT